MYFIRWTKARVFNVRGSECLLISDGPDWFGVYSLQPTWPTHMYPHWDQPWGTWKLVQAHTSLDAGHTHTCAVVHNHISVQEHLITAINISSHIQCPLRLKYGECCDVHTHLSDRATFLTHQALICPLFTMFAYNLSPIFKQTEPGWARQPALFVLVAGIPFKSVISTMAIM